LLQGIDVKIKGGKGEGRCGLVDEAARQSRGADTNVRQREQLHLSCAGRTDPEKKAKMKKEEEAQSREGVWYDDDDKKRREEDADWIQDSGPASCCRSVGKVACESRGRGRAERQSSWLRKKAGKETKETTFDRPS